MTFVVYKLSMQYCNKQLFLGTITFENFYSYYSNQQLLWTIVLITSQGHYYTSVGLSPSMGLKPTEDGLLRSP